MKTHTLMQAIGRANRVYPGKDFGLIVDYNGMPASLRAALAQYALGDDGSDGGRRSFSLTGRRSSSLTGSRSSSFTGDRSSSLSGSRSSSRKSNRPRR
jgi:hypothetical protein